MTPVTKEASNAAEAYERICKSEENLDLLRHRLGGVCVWPLFRKPVTDRITDLAASLLPKSTPRGARAWEALNDAVALTRVGRHRLLVKTYVSGLLEQTESGRFKDIWFDDILGSIANGLKIQAINSAHFDARRKRQFYPPALTTTLFDSLAGSLFTRLKPTSDVRELARVMASDLRRAFSDYAFSEQQLRQSLAVFLWQQRMYSWLLRRVDPECVAVADAGEYALVAAAKKLSIPVIELQHGINDRTHPGYAWTDYAVPYRREMPVPDRLLLWGEHWRHDLDVGGFWGDALRVTGSPRVDQYRSQPRQKAERCSVLFTSQGIAVEAVAALLRQVVDQLGDSFELNVKLHPIFDTRPEPYYRAFEGHSQVRVLAADQEASTLSLLKRADVHVSISSASHYDALGLQVPTVILAMQTHEVVLPIVALGHGLLARDASHLAAMIRHARTRVVGPDVSNFYFTSNAIDNISAEIESLRVGRRNPHI